MPFQRWWHLVVFASLPSLSQFTPTIAIPLLVQNIFEPVEIRHPSLHVEMHVDSPKSVHRKIDQCLTFWRLRQILWLHGDHRSSVSTNCRNRRFRFLDVQAATTKAPSRAKVKAASRPMPPPAPMMMQTFPESLFDTVLPILGPVSAPIFPLQKPLANVREHPAQLAFRVVRSRACASRAAAKQCSFES
jgi:hypothetical protein